MDIYDPAEDSYLLQKFVKEYAFGRVLDLGTGSGIQALTAAENKNVREVLAVDINEEALQKLKESEEVKLNTKLKVKKSDLFSGVENKFDLIIFNPPYLPQDKVGKEIIEDPALYGGKQGWEISERFFGEVSNYLAPNGRILFLFSSLTNKEKIDEFLSTNLLKFKELACEKMPMFEELYVYLVEKSNILRELERKGVIEIRYLTHGKRGNIFVGVIDKSTLVKTHFPLKKDLVKVAIKVKRKESQAQGRIENEANWLKILNKEGIGPRFMFSGEEYLVYRFVEGEFILDWIEQSNKAEIKELLLEILEQCYTLDKLGVNKEEMHHPHKHIIVTSENLPVLLDFERCAKTISPKNVTQCIEFFTRIEKLELDSEILRNLAKEYKDNICDTTFNKIRSYLLNGFLA
ncbi:hypothetical protein COY27_00895 [Candidatus Woesearchaeota archaeon CG_4_10_14_0_2_um_filter_33_13]|nr:MAG: hypothetical protein COY27_00895 [Candidatus Woesearchaeota archaeon CG_4_10_14_0_2_um_filter_33_13]